MHVKFKKILDMQILNIATFNVRGLCDDVKKDNLVIDMKRYFVDNASTAKNPVISPNFLVWNKNCAFPQNFHTRKLGVITGFFAVMPTRNEDKKWTKH